MAGGPQGSGVDTASNIFGRACGYGGLYVFGRREFHSNIKGLHSYFHQRVSTQELLANVDAVDLLAAFDAETVVRHLNEVVPEGGVIVDSQQLGTKVRDIPTLPPEFKDETRKFMQINGVGETVNDWLEHAKKTQCPRFSRSVHGVAEPDWRETGRRANQQDYSHDKRLNYRSFVWAFQVQSRAHREGG